MNEDRMNEVVDRLKAVTEAQDRALAEERRRAEEAAMRKALVERGWHTLQPKRERVVEEINEALLPTGFQLHIAGASGAMKEREIDFFTVRFAGRQHPKLDLVRLRVGLKEDGRVIVDVLTAETTRRLRTLTYEEFSVGVWRDILLDHLDRVTREEEERAAA